MALNYIWIGFFVVAFLVGLGKLIFLQDLTVFEMMINRSFDAAKTGFKLSIGLTGVLTLWLGLLKVGERGGVVNALAWLIGPFFRRIFPEIPKDSPVFGSMIMNFAANMLGLDNAATPIGLKAMNQLQEHNPNKEVASNSQIMFLVLNTSGLTLIPVSVMTYRAEQGAANPADIFLPILLATFFSTMAGLLITSIYQRINLLQPIILAYLGGLSTLVASIFFGISLISSDRVGPISNGIAGLVLIGIMVSFVVAAARKKVNVYETFIEGAKEGFSIAIKIIPYLVGILVAIAVFRASGALDWLVEIVRFGIAAVGLPTDWVDALPTAFMKPLSGSGARAMMVEAMDYHGADHFVGKLVSTMQGSTDTTFYTLAVYFGSVGIKNSRYAVTCGLLADLAGMIAAIFIAYQFFGHLI
ncbi:MAG: nucleoside recognition domain-containing protein [Salibacteraceae bacterium]